ncbi:MAG TPA: hypothetical protein VFU59_09215, partial [Candidatus Eisenbacteria bacterium]|nr:hypothetical protein [Candidatus Eisenbacteria bacterium]
MSAGAPPARDRCAAPRPPNVLDWVAALRPLLWIPAIALFEAGRSSGGGGWWPSPGTLPALGSLLSILGAVHLANAWNDRAGDRVNRKGGIVASGSVEGRAIAVVAVSCLVVAGALSLAPSVTPGARAWLATAL